MGVVIFSPQKHPPLHSPLVFFSLSLDIMSFLSAAIALLVTFIATQWLRASKRRAGRPLPPGPPQNPLVGHLLSIPNEKQAEVFAEWGKKYGAPKSSLRIGLPLS